MRLPGVHSANIGRLVVYDGLFYTVKKTKSGRCFPVFIGEPMGRDEFLRKRDEAFETEMSERERCEKYLRGARKLTSPSAGKWMPKNWADADLRSKLLKAGLFHKVRELDRKQRGSR